MTPDRPPGVVRTGGLGPRRLATDEHQRTSTTDDVWLVVPLFNEETVIADVVRDARRTFPNVVVVDDGSSDGGADAAQAAGAVVVRHPVNLGQGAALQTGFEYARSVPSMQWVVTFDADGQHQVDRRARRCSTRPAPRTSRSSSARGSSTTARRRA